MSKDYRQLCAEIAEYDERIAELLVRMTETGDPYNDIAASIDELEEERDLLIDERNDMIGC